MTTVGDRLIDATRHLMGLPDRSPMVAVGAAEEPRPPVVNIPNAITVAGYVSTLAWLAGAHPAFAVAGHSRTGGDVKQALWDLMRDNSPISFVDAYEHKALDNNPEYLVVLEGSDTSDDDVGGWIDAHLT